MIRKIIKSQIKKSPLLAPIKRFLSQPFFIPIKRALSGYVSRYEIKKQLSQFTPGSAGKEKDKVNLTFLAAQQTIPLLNQLAERFNHSPLGERSVRDVDFYRVQVAEKTVESLVSLFNKYGSDKSAIHNYHSVYAYILASRQLEKLNLLEIGLGTNNTDVVSHMGILGHPGASLRAFRDFLPNSDIYGADIDRRILFQENRIKTFFVDQTKLETFQSLSTALGGRKFDLIIDDGLHSPNANLAVLLFALDHLAPRGYLVIEDISEHSLPVWKLVAAILPKEYEVAIVRTKHTLLFLVENTAQ